MQRGEIWMVDIQPPANEEVGHEQIGDRPAVIIQRDTANQDTAVIVPITKQMRRQSELGAFVIQPSITNGLDVLSVVMTKQIRAADVTKFRRKRGKLEAQHL